MPAVPDGPAGRALDPTEVIPRPRPPQRSAAGAARVISGEVVGPRHRARRAHRPGPGSAVTVVLSATGAVAGLSLLMPHGGGSADAAGGHTHRPGKSAPDGGVAEAVTGAAAVAGAGEAETVSATDRTATATTTITSTVTDTSATTGTSTTTTSGRHARSSGSWDTEDWQEAVATAAAAQRSTQQGQNGRHRADRPQGGQGGRQR